MKQHKQQQQHTFRVYIAHSGDQLDSDVIIQHYQQQYEQQSSLSSSSSISDNNNMKPMTVFWLKQWIAHMCNISLQNQILLSMSGMKLEDEQTIYPQISSSLIVMPSSSTSSSLSSPSQSRSPSPLSSSPSSSSSATSSPSIEEGLQIFVFDRATFLQMNEQQQQQQHVNADVNNTNNNQQQQQRLEDDQFLASMEPIRSLFAVPDLEESQIPIPPILLQYNNQNNNNSSSSSSTMNDDGSARTDHQMQHQLLLSCTRSIHILLKKAEHALSNGKLKFEALNRLVQEQRNQAMAISCSYANLNGHANNILASFKGFLSKFQKHEQRFQKLISSFDSDMTRLSTIELHPKLKTPSKQTLLDCVPEKQLRQWVPKCQRELEMFGDKLQQGIDLMNTIEKSVERENMNSPIVNFRQLSEFLKQAAITVQNEKITVETISTDYNILIDMIMKQKTTHNSSTLTSTVEVHEKNVRKMREFDQLLEIILNDCMESKVVLSRDLFDRLRNISLIQYNIKRLSRKMPVYASILRSIVGKFAHIELVHYFPGAYSLSLVEVLRRRNFLRKLASEATKYTDRLQALREEEATNRAHFDKYFSRFLPPNVIPGLQEKVPGTQMAHSFNHGSLMDTNLPSIDNPHEIQNVDLESIQSLCGHSLGQGILKMYETTLDDKQMFHQMEFSLNEADDTSFQISSYHSANNKTGAAMFHSRSSSVRSESDSPVPSPSTSPRLGSSGYLSSENYQRMSQYRKELSERDEKIDRMTREMAMLESQLSSSAPLVTHAPTPTATDTNKNSQQELLDIIQKLKSENEELKLTVDIKERLRHETAQRCEEAIRESHKLKETLNQYANTIKSASEVLLDKSNDTMNRKTLHSIISQIDSSKNLSPVNLEDFMTQLSIQVKRNP